MLGAERVRELSQWLVERNAAFEPADPTAQPPRVALQDSCHLRNGMRVTAQPRALIAQIADYVELPSAGECCGAAGTYAILRPRDSRRILDDKIREIDRARVDIVVTVNPGCYRQLEQGVRRAGLGTKVVHLAELLAQARRARQ